jgi:hypothetical protein
VVEDSWTAPHSEVTFRIRGATFRDIEVDVRRHPRELGSVVLMATTDYDAPRGATVDLAEDSLEELKARSTEAQSPTVDIDETADGFELPVGELLDEELSVAVIPMRLDEFRCTRCFLVHHRSQLATQRGADLICRECV